MQFVSCLQNLIAINNFDPANFKKYTKSYLYQEDWSYWIMSKNRNSELKFRKPE